MAVKQNNLRVAGATKGKVSNVNKFIKTTLFGIKKLFTGSDPEGQMKLSIQKAVLWVRKFVEEFSTSDDEKKGLIDRHILKPGYFYMFTYESKLYNEIRKNGNRKLAYYDEYPLILVLKVGREGFLGFNFHYLHPKIRLRVMDKLIRIYGKFYVQDQLLMPMKPELFKTNMGPLWKFAQHGVKKYLWSNVTRMRGMKVRRVKNLDVPQALLFVSPGWVGGVRDNDVWKETSFGK
jgi:hypothetical protein